MSQFSSKYNQPQSVLTELIQLHDNTHEDHMFSFPCLRNKHRLYSFLDYKMQHNYNKAQLKALWVAVSYRIKIMNTRFCNYWAIFVHVTIVIRNMNCQESIKSCRTACHCNILAVKCGKSSEQGGLQSLMRSERL